MANSLTNPDRCCGNMGCPPYPGPDQLTVTVAGVTFTIPRTAPQEWEGQDGSLCGTGVQIYARIRCTGEPQAVFDILPATSPCNLTTTTGVVQSWNPIVIDFFMETPGTCCVGSSAGTVTE